MLTQLEVKGLTEYDPSHIWGLKIRSKGATKGQRGN